MDRRDEDHPLMRRGMRYKQANDLDRAMIAFQEALDQKSTLARAHLELGLLFDRTQTNYLRAIYHYERYLQLRPQAEKREYVEQMIRYARYSFAATLRDQPTEAIQVITQVKDENQSLRAQLDQARTLLDETARENRDLKVTLDQLRKRQLDRPSPGASPFSDRDFAAPAQPTAPGSFTEVQRGETLSSIAARIYGDAAQWPRIFDANRQTLKTPGDVRPGQKLVIPPHPERRYSP